MSLIPVGQSPLTLWKAAQNAKPNDSAYLADGFVWTASASEDGTFTFYAVPQEGAANGSSTSQWDSPSNAQSAFGWNSLYSQDAVAQYTFCASFPSAYADASGNGQLVNVYA